LTPITIIIIINEIKNLETALDIFLYTIATIWLGIGIIFATLVVTMVLFVIFFYPRRDPIPKESIGSATIGLLMVIGMAITIWTALTFLWPLIILINPAIREYFVNFFGIPLKKVWYKIKRRKLFYS